MRKISRRTYLTTSAAAAGALLVPGMASGADKKGRKKQTAAGDKLNIACVGIGGQGRHDVNQVAGENIVALCDVNLNAATQNFKAYPKAKQYRDFRRMLIEMDDEIDALTVSTPDHMHAPVTMTAMQLGLSVYTQKPLTEPFMNRVN